MNLTSVKKRIIFFLTGFPLLLGIILLGQRGETAVSPVAAGTAEWPMVAANPQRTSWTPEEVGGQLRPEWYKPFEAFIPPHVQIIAANNTLYISTASGLYAIDAATGAEKWVYATEMPLGHSPTIYNGVAYVGGLDNKIHAIDANSGVGLWTFSGGGGFETNPLIINDILYAGNRDGKMYAITISGANTGKLAWSYQTGGPVLFSAAYNNGNIYFASNDSFAYALNANSGSLVWKSAKLPGAGFFSYWPVVYEDKVIFSGSNAYTTAISWPGSGQMSKIELQELYVNQGVPPGAIIGGVSTAAGDWVSGTPTINAGRIYNYFDAKPWRRTVFVLNQSNGAENVTAPVLWTGTGSGTRYPPVIGVDGVLYQQNNYISDASIARGHVAGWQPDNPYITNISGDVAAVDEPHAVSGGGNLIYWNLCCDRQSGSIDITKPNSSFPNGGVDPNREWIYYGYNLLSWAPGYNFLYYSAQPDNYTKPYSNFGTVNGVYGFHGDVSPPIPYNGRVYIQRSNTIMAFSPSGNGATALPTATKRTPPPANMDIPDQDELIAELEAEVSKIVEAGHLRPGFMSHGLFDNSAGNTCGDNLVAYWSNPGDTLYTLLMALPHLSPGLQQTVRTYLQNEYANYPPYQYNHVGWSNGAQREAYTMPPEIVAALTGPETKNFTLQNNGGWGGEGVWGRNPFAWYALWKYAEEFGGASGILSASQSAFMEEFNGQPSDGLLLKMPLVHNAYIAGYTGYVELQKLAGQTVSSSVNGELNRLKALRANNFTKDTAYQLVTNGGPYCRTLNVASNFMYLVPELAEYLRNNALGGVNSALAEYETVAPYWFVTFFSGAYAENAIVPLYDAHSIFMAKALILEATGDELAQYLDVPGFPTGDLFYIQKLTAAIDNQVYGFSLNVKPAVANVDSGGSANYQISVAGTGGFVAPINIQVTENYGTLVASPASTTLTPPGNMTVTLDDNSTGDDTRWYVVTVTATGDGIQKTIELRMLINGEESFLPIVSNK
ncbi:MAG: PQQ-binding-like beta-propeller repeat protein [Ardenticatenaceae bacterium]|nr:PQQ-binding-like beta-propeller repeat protein [Ardenticatenaceae bacterium]MCB8946636.1 PQQ-binding-like beta-propeller repeat protein [Ardenticatenaceae bacterium]